MNAPLRKTNEVSSSGGNIIRFPGSDVSSSAGSIPEFVLTGNLNIPEFENKLKSAVESAVFDAYLNLQLSEMKSLGNPFDAIYIAQLKSDPITTDEIQHIIRYASVTDLSSSIEFIDEWED